MADFADSTTTELERKIPPLRVMALTETVTYCVLAYFWLTGNRPGRLLMGSMHGMIAMFFAGMVVGIRADLRWTWKFAIAAIALGPIGSILVYARLKREGIPAEA